MIDSRISHLLPFIDPNIRILDVRISSIAKDGRGDVIFSFKDFICRRTRTLCRELKFTEEETLIWVLKFGEMLPDTIKGEELIHRGY